jgi:hypothetical protein
MSFLRTAWQSFKDIRCHNGFHFSWKRERMLVRREFQVSSGGDWPQYHTEFRDVPSGRVKITCRNCGRHYFLFDSG